MPDPYPGWTSDELLVPFRDWYFPGAALQVVECEGVRVRAVVSGHSRAVTGFWPFPLYFEPLDDAGNAAVSVPYLTDVVVGVTRVGAPGPAKAVPAPYVDWRGVTSFEDYMASRNPLPGQDSPQTIQRKARKLERELGSLTFRRDIDDPALFDLLLGWKMAQYASAGGANRLDRSYNREFHHELRRRGVSSASVLEAHGRVIAGKIGMFAQRRQFSRITVFDPSLRKLSPGSVLEMESMRASFEAGEVEFDFLAGRQPYKFTWATHVRWLGSLGREPRRDRLARQAKARIGRVLRGKRWANSVRDPVSRLVRRRRK